MIHSLGVATCTGGLKITPPLDSFPLLVHANGEIRTEDGKTCLRDYIVSGKRPADFYGTSDEHIRQLHAYGILAGLIDFYGTSDEHIRQLHAYGILAGLIDF